MTVFVQNILASYFIASILIGIDYLVYRNKNRLPGVMVVSSVFGALIVIIWRML
jgi:hypothetical protein